MSTPSLGKNLRKQFPIFKNNDNAKSAKHNFHYLDSASSAQKPSAVIKTMQHHAEYDYANIHRGAYSLSARSTALYEDARVQTAQFLAGGVKAHQIVFTRGTTDSINMLATGLAQTKLTKSSRIVIPMSEHHSNFIPWQQAALKKNCELAYIHLKGTQGHDLRLNLDEAAKLMTKNTRVVSFAHMGNVIGQINPLKKLIELAKNVGALVIVDCAQSVTCLSQDLFALGVDALAFSGHKIYGPTGIGVLALNDELAKILPPTSFGGGMVSAVTEEEAQWAMPPAKFEAGTPPITEAIGLAEAFRWYGKLGGQERVHAHCSGLNSLFVKGLKKIKEIELFTPDTGEETMVAFRHRQIHSHDLATILDANNIAMRSGHHCAWPLVQFLKVDSLCRASFAVYNDEDDVEISLETLKKASLF